jgi:hypothetical protein
MPEGRCSDAFISPDIFCLRVTKPTPYNARVLVSQSAEGLLTTSPHFTSNFSVERVMVRH